MSRVSAKELLLITGWNHPKLSRALHTVPSIWSDPPTGSRGGPQKLYAVDYLPADLQLLIKTHRAEQFAQESTSDPLNAVLITNSRKRAPIRSANGNGSTAPAPFNPTTGEGLNKKESNRALLVSRLVSEYRVHYAGCTNGAVIKAKKNFIEQYNLGEGGILPAIYSTIGKTSFQTVERWDLSLRRNENDPFALADRRGKHRKGASSISPEQEAILKTFAFHPNQLLDSEIIRSAVTRMKHDGIPCTQSEDTFRRYLEKIKREDYADWVFRREGWKALNEKCLFHITRDYDAIEVGDIAFADGHVMNFECLNPWTGKPKRMDLIMFYDMKSNYPLGWEIMPTENTQAIKIALYRSILTLGKIPNVPYLDNGRAFRGQFFTGTKDFKEIPEVGLFDRLGMKPIFAWPYHAETKPIEGFFKIFGELERQAPSYCGTSIGTKPARMKRGELIHRKLYECLTAGRVPTIIDAHLAIAHWIDTEYSVRPQAGHLKGKCPLEVFLDGKGPGLSDEDKIRLRLLMAEMPVKKIPRDGIRMPWSDKRYYHPDLFGRQNQGGYVRYDWQDASSVYVYDAEGNFVCEARQSEKVHPAAQHLGTDDDVSELARQLEMKAHLAKSVTGRATEFIASQVVPQVRRQIEDIASRENSICEGAPDRALREPENCLETTLTPEQCEAATREFEELLAAQGRPTCQIAQVPVCASEPEFRPEREMLLSMSDMDRYETLTEWSARGVVLDMEDKRWMGMYEKSEEYERFRGYFEDTEMKFNLFYGSAR